MFSMTLGTTGDIYAFLNRFPAMTDISFRSFFMAYSTIYLFQFFIVGEINPFQIDMTVYTTKILMNRKS